MKRVFWVLGACVLVAAGGLYATGHLPMDQLLLRRPAKSTQHDPAPPAATVIKAAVATFKETILVTGTLVPRDEILVAPEIEGLRVMTLQVDEGDRVVKGQVMATLVQESLEAQLAQSTANVAKAEAAIAQARSNIAQAEARVSEASSSYDRAKPLRQSGFLSESVFDQRESAAKTAEALLVSARDGLKVAEAEKAYVEAQRRELLWRRANTEVRAPASGIVSRRNARVGAMASAIADPLFRIIANGEVELDAEVPEAQLARIKTGQPAEVSTAGYPEIRGRVRLVSPEVDKATRLGRVRVALQGDALRIGAFGRGTIVTETGQGIAVPESAVLYGAESAYVQTVKDGHVVSRAIKTGLKANGMIEVRDGLTNGDVVIARSGTFLRDGDVVRPVAADQAKVSDAR